MAGSLGVGEGGGVSPWRILGWGSAGCLLLLPLVAMQFTDEVQWTGSDFVFAGVMIGGAGLLFEWGARLSRDSVYRAGVAAALAAAFATVWANAAVGMIGSEDNPFNLLFLGVIALALAGAAVARFRPAGMTRAMLLAAVAQLAVSLAGLPADQRGGLFSAGFAGLWLLAAALFGKSARDS